ncbi:lysophospholipid acyltransferase family protein [Candidatus Frankia alpina]|uniref:lysophospholipid acyltransferase family protein n=1 Tax=Candidatus Frankia alpina TaxID=2699483 RepID=UPI001F242E08|nr:lysophospholipid acyltransferase family protein [Candidatus Frankia alpina]
MAAFSARNPERWSSGSSKGDRLRRRTTDGRECRGANLEGGTAMPQVQTLVGQVDIAVPQLVPAQRDSTIAAPAAHRADAWSRISYVCMKKVLSPICQAFWHPLVEGLENIPTDGPAIIASNHLSALDAVFLAVASDRRITFLAKSEYFTTPGLKGMAGKMFVAATGQIAVDRGNRRKANAALQAGAGVLSRGDLLAIFPEGTRSPDGRLYRGKHGVARLALETGVPVIPVGLIGTFQVLPMDRRLPRAGRVQMRFGQPLTFPRMTDGRTGLAQRAATEQIMKPIQELVRAAPGGHLRRALQGLLGTCQPMTIR